MPAGAQQHYANPMSVTLSIVEALSPGGKANMQAEPEEDGTIIAVGPNWIRIFVFYYTRINTVSMHSFVQHPRRQMTMTTRDMQTTEHNA
jgi:hypothetical protein